MIPNFYSCLFSNETMDSDEITFTKLEKHITRDINDKHENGSLTVVWRDWDKIFTYNSKNGLSKFHKFW